MERVTYVKFNSTRKPEYRITTEFHENKDEKWVIKRAGDPSATAHLKQIATNREILLKIYKDVSVLDVKREEDQLRFPFAFGKVLSEKLEESKPVKEEFVEKANQLFDQIISIEDECICSFVHTEDFASFFGERYPEEGIQAICPVNLDSLFSNFIETDQGIVCLDYEWVFNFPIPIEYLKYRAIRYFYNEREKSLFDGIARDTVMNWFGFDSSKLEIFWSMESFFQQRIYGMEWQYLYLDKYKKEEITLQKLNDEIAKGSRIIQYNEYLIQRQEGDLKTREKEINGLEQEISEIRKTISEQDKQIYSLVQETSVYKQTISGQELRIQDLEDSLRVIENSRSWQMTKPMRSIGEHIRRFMKK